MNGVFSIILFMIMITVLILLTMTVKHMSHEIDELKEELEKHRARFNYLEFDYLSISDIEERLDKLEEALELKEYYDDTSLNKK